MQSAINLLPKDVRISESTRARARKIKQISITTALFFVTLAISLSLYNYYLNNQVKKLTQEGSDLRANIQALEGTEQRLVLYRDRILKLQNLLATQTVNKSLPLQKSTINEIQEVDLETASLTESEQSLGVSSVASSSLRDYLEKIEKLPYQSLTLKDITFNNVAGFRAEFSYTRAE